MKKLISLILIIINCTTTYAQNSVDTDQGATSILRKMATQYNAYSSMQFNFTVKVVKDKKTLDTFQGELKVKKNKYTMFLEEQKVYCDGVNLWNYQKESNEVSIFSFEEGDEPIFHPKILINWEKNFRAQFIRELAENNKMLYVVDLLPLQSQSYYKIRAYINKSNHQIVRFEMYDKNNSISTLSVDKFVVNKPIEDSLFIFNATQYPNVFINDMR